MDFIWRNKGALAVAAVLGTFIKDPEVYINGVKSLVAEPVAEQVMGGTNWTLIIGIAALIGFLPFIARSLKRAALEIKRKRPQDRKK
ncbi:MAG: hypothetical protein QMD09_14540, partial [Desulfatibacillaceae bacterium]|nr:hypothetical protein [Desulfatibacillaceae bacterium]